MASRVETLAADDGTYVGEVIDVEEDGELTTVPHGKGKFTWDTGDVYDGEWRHNKQAGKGKFTFASGGFYEGQWQDDEQHGIGHLEDVNGTYEGQFANDARHGRGKQYYKNGDVYDGQWKNDKRDGLGSQTWAAGDKYEGDWADDQMHGKGTYQFANGDIYAGDFVHDVKTGQGEYIWADTSDDLERYTGGFANGKRHGQGVERYRNGDWLAGTWEHGEHNGVQKRVKRAEQKAKAEGVAVQLPQATVQPKVDDGLMAKLEAANETGETVPVVVPAAAAATVQAPSAVSNSSLQGKSIETFLQDEGSDGLTGWRLGNMLGQGSYGAVYAGLRRDGGMMAVKCMELGSIEEQEDLDSLMNEIEVMKDLSHSNIVRYLGAQKDEKSNVLHIFLEYVPGGSLASVVKKFGNLDHETSRRYTKQILFAVSFLHRKNVMHRDIKGDNILLTGEGVVKLADFGCSKNMTQLCAKTHGVGAKTMVGTPYWMAPEVITSDSSGSYSYKADVWSVGCTVCEMLSGKPPWPEFSSMWGAVYHIANSTGRPDGIPKDMPPSISSFFDQCLARKPAERATADELLCHEWMKQA